MNNTTCTADPRIQEILDLATEDVRPLALRAEVICALEDAGWLADPFTGQIWRDPNACRQPALTLTILATLLYTNVCPLCNGAPEIVASNDQPTTWCVQCSSCLESADDPSGNPCGRQVTARIAVDAWNRYARRERTRQRRLNPSSLFAQES